MKTTTYTCYMIAVVGILITYTSVTGLQAQNRLYLPIGVNNNGTVKAQGLRIKQSSDFQRYWLLGNTDATVGGTFRGMAVVNIDPNSLATLSHAYYPLPAGIAGNNMAQDFEVENDYIVTAGTLYTVTPPWGSTTKLTSIQPNLLPLSLVRYLGVPYQLNAKCIISDIGFPNPYYVVASDGYRVTLFPTPTGPTGTSVAAIDKVTLAVNWQIFISSPAGTHTFVKDMIRDANGNYYIVGVMVDNNINQNKGVIIRVSNTGAFLGKSEYPYLGGGNLEFNSVSLVPGIGAIIPPRYVISGTAQATGQRKSIFVGTFDNNGNPDKTFVHRVAGGGADAEGYRHVLLTDNNGTRYITIAGKITHYPFGGTFYSTGTLLRLIYNNNSEDCATWFNTWKEYGYFDGYQYRSHALQDVTRKVGGTIEVSAIGTAYGADPSVQGDYVFWMDTDTFLSSDVSERCFEGEVFDTCSTLPTTPISSITSIDSGTYVFDPFIVPYYTGDEQLDCDDILHKSSTQEEGIPIKGYENSVALSPMPNDGGMSIVDFSLSESDDVQIALYDAAGAKVMDIASQYLKAGRHNLRFDCSALASGMYALRVHGTSINKTLMLPVVR